MSAGQYPSRIQVLERTVTTNELGEVEETFVEGQILWCRIEEDSPRRVPELGANQTGIDGTISIRGYVAFDTRDMVRDSSGRTWKIEGRTRGVNETILQVYTDDTLIDWVEEGS